MCVDHSRNCSCGKGVASFNFKDEVLPFETVTNIYCPACSPQASFDPATMIKDNGWYIEYNMDVARFLLSKVAPASEVSPDYVFDEGYCTWRGVYPGDHIDSANERNELSQLAKTDPRKYFEELKNWSIKRMERLAEAGWRKAVDKEPAKV